MFESSSNTSLPAISLDSLKAITEMALFGHSLFLASHSAVTTTSPIIGGRTIASPEPISGDEKQKEVQAVVQACLGCQATDTPEWRRGPLGPRTLCNACVSGKGRGRSVRRVFMLIYRLDLAGSGVCQAGE
jgi:hypothetical protein